MKFRKTIVKKLYQLINWLNKENPNSHRTNNQIDSLAPKILTEEKDVNRIKPYLDSLKKVIEAKNITNIALTGNYGSGKSTILKTFQHLNPNHIYLNISLASFKDNKNDDEELERKLEISILQQIFYHVKPSDIPDSRFKRIVNITTKKLWGIAIAFILWLISLVILFKFGYIEKLNPETWNTEYNLDWLALFVITIFFTGIGLFSKIIIRLFSNSKINKFNIKGELELGNDIDKSVFNEHLEEIIYFFERTDYNVIIIEDLDRFESTDIFTKLREINILLNSSKLIHREINFVYAVRDEMFTDKSERVKFFEYIIPVIPFINPSNAGEQLAKLIENANLENILTKDFTEDIVTFIDDIDMRLLTNIFHEYQLYKNNLSSDLNQDNLFAIIVYKNMFPDDFGLLHKRDGKLYKFIANKDSYIKGLLENINNKIVSSQTSIDIIKKESTDNISDLKSIYINAIHLNIPRANSLIIEDDEILFSELVKDDYFDSLENVSNIGYYQFTTNQYYGGNRYDKTTKYSNISFSDIENYVNRDFTYQERKQQILDKTNGRIEQIQVELEKLKIKKQEIESWTLREIFDEIDITPYINVFSENPLIRNLLINGYINENYDDYISLFHEINLTKEDYSFLRNIKSGISTTFEYQLNKIENLIKKIPEKYYKREVILNFDLIDFLGKNLDQYEKEYESIIQLLSNEKEKSIEFICSYIDKRTQNHNIFIKSLCKSWVGYWNYIYLNNNFSDEKKIIYLTLIVKYVDLDDIHTQNNDNNLSSYISQYSNFLSIADSNYYDKIKSIIKKLNIKFHSFDSLSIQNKELLNYVYQNNYYQINGNNIFLMISKFGNEINLDNFNTVNYSIISSSNCNYLISYINDNINSYIKNVFLKLSDENEESESMLINLLNNNKLDKKLKFEIISKQNNLIEDISTIDSFDLQQNLLENNKISPHWNNIFFYYSQLEDKALDEVLISYLNEEFNYQSLDSMSLSHERGRDFIKEFTLKLVYCDELAQESYENLISKTPFSWNSLDIQNLTVDKVKYLVNNKMSFSKNNFDKLKESFPNLHIELLEKYSNIIREKFDDFQYIEDDIVLLLKSQTISQNIKVDVIEIMEHQFIIDNKEIRQLSSTLLATSRYIELDFNVIESIFLNITSIDTRLKILNKNIDNYSNSEIQTLIELLGGDYKRIFIKQNKPTFRNDDTHSNLFTKLESKNLILRFEEIKDGKQIKAFALYH